MIICRHRVQSGVGSISQPCSLDCAQTRRLSNTQGSLTFFLMVRASFLDRHNMIAQTPEPERTNAAVQHHVLPVASSPLTPPSHSSCESLSTSHTDLIYSPAVLLCTVQSSRILPSKIRINVNKSHHTTTNNTATKCAGGKLRQASGGVHQNRRIRVYHWPYCTHNCVFQLKPLLLSPDPGLPHLSCCIHTQYLS